MNTVCPLSQVIQPNSDNHTIEFLQKALEVVPNNVYQHLQTGCCCRAKIRQIARSRKCSTNEDEERLQ
ncbi:hypothetical protein HPG69_019556 [Diceros bicornis minor]|uniref:Uncharacterized protein n=1 Tax=Diceros bicornis minor TaxID=77932 RepID=A0A7J7E5W5_DICBM|nr:hypothetical protein HPG69_019556 [Diceros bicornis minor]